MNNRVVVCLIIGALSIGLQTACSSMSTEELKSSIEIVDVHTVWVSKYYQPWPPRLILVPQIAFKVKNIGPKPLSYVNFNAVFKFKGEPGNLGDSFLAAIRKDAVPPGGTSDAISLKSNFGVEGKTLASFKENPLWKPTIVRLFARSKGSQFIQVGEFDIGRTIDFKEPEPVELKKKETSHP